MDMYSRVKRRRKSLRRNSYGIQNHHEVSTEGEEEGMGCKKFWDLSEILIKQSSPCHRIAMYCTAESRTNPGF